MAECKFFETKSGRKLAYEQLEGAAPGVVFMGGFKSDMQGSKAQHLAAWAKREGRAFLRFDYSGHGQSSGEFTDGCIGDWAEETNEIVSALTVGPQVVVGSSMGGWMALLLARAKPEKIYGFVGIASAPDFTEDSMWDGFNAAQKAEMERDGQVALPSEYGEPYIITKRLIEDGRKQLVLRSPLRLPFPVRLLHGTADEDVAVSVALRLLNHVDGENIRLTLEKGADHRFSNARCLTHICDAISQVTEQAPICP